MPPPARADRKELAVELSQALRMTGSPSTVAGGVCDCQKRYAPGEEPSTSSPTIEVPEIVNASIRDPRRDHVTDLLLAWQNGDDDAYKDLIEIVYGELWKTAAGLLRHGGRDQTLRPTALVNEAYIRLISQDRVSWRDRRHFFGVAATVMRRILVDHARHRRAKKRGGAGPILSLEGFEPEAATPAFDPLVLDDALRRLEELDTRKAEIVQLRFFGGLTIQEIARAQGRSRATIERHWEMARVWLFRELSLQDVGEQNGKEV